MNYHTASLARGKIVQMKLALAINIQVFWAKARLRNIFIPRLIPNNRDVKNTKVVAIEPKNISVSKRLFP